IEPEPQLLGELVARLYEPVSACSRPLPAARELLRELKRAGLRLALISNTPWDVPGHLVQRDLARFGLDEYLDTRVFSDRGHRKPHPELFRRALAALGTSPADTIMVGDSLPEDVAGAKTAGMRTLWVGAERELAVRDGSDVTPDYVAEDLPAAGRILLGLVAKS
ncbi:MAG: HAD family hydrolase, partial [Armatimonadota bacterium]